MLPTISWRTLTAYRKDAAGIPLGQEFRMPRPIALVVTLLCLPALAHAGDEPTAGKPAIDAGIVALFDAVRVAARDEDHAALASHFDVEQMTRILEEDGYLPVPDTQRAAARMALAAGLQRGLSQRPMVMPFASYTIRSVTAGKHPDTAIVYAQLRDAEGNVGKVRWHLTKREGAWRIHDIEDLDMGLGILHLMGALLLDAVEGTPQTWHGKLANLARAHELLMSGGFAEAHELLIEVEVLALPDALRSLVQMLLSVCAMGLEDNEEALRHLDVVAKLQPDVPIQYYFRATIDNIEGRHESALGHARRYIELLGADAAANLEIGIALHGLGRKEEALQALEPALKESPTDLETLSFLALCLPESRYGELATHFKALPDPVLGHRELADRFREHENLALLRLVTGLFRQVAPEHYDVPFYQGHALLLEGKFHEAASRFEVAQQAMFSAPEAERPEDPYTRLLYLDGLLDALVRAGDPVGAYQRTLDPSYAFDYIADALVERKDVARLRTYLAHVLAHPPEAKAATILLQVPFYGAEADLMEGKHAEAVEKLQPLLPRVEQSLAADPENEAVGILVWDVEDRLVRALLALKRHEPAAALAAKIAERDADHFYAAMVHIARGEVAQATAAIEAAVERGRAPSDFFEDPDMAAALAGEAYAALRKKLLGDG